MNEGLTIWLQFFTAAQLQKGHYTFIVAMQVDVGSSLFLTPF